MSTRKPPVTVEDDETPPEFPAGFSDAATALAAIGRHSPMLDEEDIDDVTALNNVLNELGGVDSTGGFVSVYKEVTKPNGTREDGYIGKFPVTEFTLDALKEQFGAGRYNIRVYKSGVRGVFTHKTINIVDTVRPAAVITQPAVDNSGIEKLASTMLAGFQELGKLIVATKPAEVSEDKLLQRMMMYKELFADRSAPQVPQYNPIDLMMKGMEMAQMAGGGGEGNSVWVSKAIETFGPTLSALFENKMSAAASTPAPVRTAAPQPAAIPAPTNEDENMMKMYIKMLEAAAAKGDDTAEWANRILDLLPADQVTEVETLLRGDDWKQKVSNLTPAVVTYEPWFTSLRDILLDFIEQDRQLTPGGVSANLSGHETGKPATHQPGESTGSVTA